MVNWLVVASLLGPLAWLTHRADLFWCEARSIRQGTSWRAPGYSLVQLPDLSGRTALVTGANSGIGREVARQLVLANASVLLGCRDAEKCARTAAAIGGRPLALDLNSLHQVAEVARKVRREVQSLDLLVNAAGLATQMPLALSADGVEVTFQANYLGHFLLTARLLPMLGTVVQLSSGAHRGAPAEGVPLSLAHLNGPMGAYARYGVAKLANLVLAEELARRAPGIRSCAVHPGVVATNMLRESNFRAMLGAWVGPLALQLAKWRNALFAYSPEEAAVTVLHCALGPVEGNGGFYVPIAKRWPPRHPKAGDAAFASALWNFSEALVKKALGEEALQQF